ncbi:MAG TPA: HAD family hydrolase [Spirochaetales bacterium]|nr:HAD family hydrolase [Spirochaetales bacterium]HRY53414.1 HAD family hydrolase [Spirochaetia bacterium]HRZ63556.1 HAD family hydrolase [Spirochaetia bacterium]
MKAAIFDLDGTLADTIGDISAAVNRSLARRGFPVHGAGDYKLMVGNGFRNLVTKALPPSERSEARIEELRAESAADYEAHCFDLTRPYPGVRELLAALAGEGLPMAVLSNKIQALTAKVVAGLFPEIPFVLVRGEGPGFPRKPDPAAALDAARLLGVPPAEVAYLGDSDVDMRTAAAAGMLALGAAWGFRGEAELRAAGADAVLAEPGEMLRYF